MNRIALVLIVLTSLGGAGCHSIGPGTIPRDRLDYNESISDSWKRQVLRNLVKMRYLDAPIFLDVSQVVSGYTLETGASVSGQVAPPGRAGDTFVGVGGHGTFTDRPTITYTPLTGDKFLRSMVDPVPPRTIFHLAQSGYAADFLLELSLDSLSGLRNRSARPGLTRPADPGFIRVIGLIRQVQDAGALGLQVEGTTNPPVLFFRQENVPPETLTQIEEIKRLLQLPSGESRFSLVYSPVAGTAGELAVGSRSVLQMMIALATFVEVPKEDVEQQRAIPVPDTSGWPEPMFRVRCTAAKPEDAFAMVQYRKHWFWIDDRDLRSKRTMTAILFLFTLSDTGATERPPMLTIPAG